MTISAEDKTAVEAILAGVTVVVDGEEASTYAAKLAGMHRIMPDGTNDALFVARREIRQIVGGPGLRELFDLALNSEWPE